MMVKEMIKNDKLRQQLPCKSIAEEFNEMEAEEQEIYLFMRGGLTAK